jgi:acyl carrier protein
MNELLTIINIVLVNKGKSPLASIDEATSLRRDVGFDSLDLAEFTVRIEEKFGVDIFEDGIADTIRDVLAKIRK